MNAPLVLYAAPAFRIDYVIDEAFMPDEVETWKHWAHKWMEEAQRQAVEIRALRAELAACVEAEGE